MAPLGTIKQIEEPNKKRAMMALTFFLQQFKYTHLESNQKPSVP